MSSSLSKGFVSKSSDRMVQKMAQYKNGKEKIHNNRGANITEMKQQGQGFNMFFQTSHGNGFSENIFHSKKEVSFYSVFLFNSINK